MPGPDNEEIPQTHTEAYQEPHPETFEATPQVPWPSWRLDGVSILDRIPADQPLLSNELFPWDPNQSHDDPMSPYTEQDSDFYDNLPTAEEREEQERNQMEQSAEEDQAGPAPYEVLIEFQSAWPPEAEGGENDAENDADREDDEEADEEEESNVAARTHAVQGHNGGIRVYLVGGRGAHAVHGNASTSRGASATLGNGDDDDDDDDDNHDDSDYDDGAAAEGEEEEDDDEDGGEDEDDDDDEFDHAGGNRIIEALRNGTDIGELTRGALLALLRHNDLTNVLFQDNEQADLDFLAEEWERQRRPPKDPNRFPKVPSKEGMRLMHSGSFGVTDYNERIKKPLSIRLLERELGLGDLTERKKNGGLIAQSMLPSSRADKIIHFEEPVYSGQFSDDGNFFYAASQDFKVRMYDTSNPYSWKYYKTVTYPVGQWTLTDASLSPDNKFLAFTSISPIVSIAPTDPLDTGDPYSLDFDTGTRPWMFRRLSFGIWSIRFSGDGRELVAGTNASSIIIYDIERRTVLNHFVGHENHVNAVCFADKNAPHLIYSGSDDTTMKVWDRRSMGDRREAGAFVGHVEGLTYIDSKGDGRYILSNGKDQSMKLWDIRQALTTAEVNELDPTQHTRFSSGFDYRAGTYNENWWDPHPNDNSLVTFRGHKVLRTLIRCHFSPQNSSNSHYVYTGSADGKVYIYNLDATIQRVIDVKSATRGTQRHDRRFHFYHFDESPSWGTCVRDASWHPNAPVLVDSIASAWNGYSMSRGTLSVHSVNSSMGDEGEPLGQSVDYELRRDPELLDSKYMTEHD
ncbi:WD40-repeat-containing domain protein [Mariannaea sp. PMI_226]|nr:WD40-repeat-containing domain protein [Mariannaea sp. PMI_226]